ncbi:hypothetical protein V2G26_016683 [Clonostachys chloroleuca]
MAATDNRHSTPMLGSVLCLLCLYLYHPHVVREQFCGELIDLLSFQYHAGTFLSKHCQGAHQLTVKLPHGVRGPPHPPRIGLALASPSPSPPTYIPQKKKSPLLPRLGTRA